MTIKVASYNIRKAIGLDRKRSPERTLEVLRELDADVIALQEADRRFGGRAAAIPLGMLEEYSPYKAVALDMRPDSIGWHGNAILVKKEVVVDHCEPVYLPTLEPRGAVLAELSINGTAVRVVGMHLDLSGLWRRRQVKALLNHLAATGRPMPTIMMGDLNEWTNRGCLKDFGVDHRVLRTGRSFHSRRPVGELDRIILSTDIEVGEYGVHHSLTAARASDHLPIWAEIMLPDATPAPPLPKN